MNDDPLIGKTIGNYSIERLLGHGGMAQVYYGQDIKLQRPVAIKVIDPRYRGKTAQARRFIKEARVMAKWKHENIVQIYSADDEGDLYYYVMEYVDGKDLASIISSYAADGELIPPADVIRIGRAIANALDYAHKQGVIHRDVKPSNVLCSLDGRVMLSDFGLALDLADGSLGEVFGTAHYISPEQARRSADAVPQSDVYSLGVILYEMLTGSVPFTDPSPASVALHHISDAPPPPRLRNPDIQPAVEMVLLQALEKEPARRFQSGAELMDALEAAFAQPKQATGLTLPPLPIGVPTIRRRAISRSSVSDRITGRVPEEVAPTVRSAGTVQRELSSRGRSIWRTLGLIALTILLIGLAASLLWTYRGAIFTNLPDATQPTLTALPTLAPATETSLPTQPAADTPLPGPSLTPAWNSTATIPPPTSTSAATTLAPSQSATTTTPLASLTVTPTAPFPNGNIFLLLYNNSSFIIINQSKVTRSVSGFTFERLDNGDAPIGTFHGWSWERYYPNLGPTRCMALFVLNSAPYLEPIECGQNYASALSYAADDPIVFWTARDNSRNFRVLWEDVEIARCEIVAGWCEIRVP